MPLGAHLIGLDDDALLLPPPLEGGQSFSHSLLVIKQITPDLRDKHVDWALLDPR